MPGFSLIAYAAAIDTLKLANRVEGRELYSWETITPKDRIVKASNGLEVRPNRLYKETDNYDVLIVCGGLDIRKAWDECKSLGQYLTFHASQGIALGALYTGTYVLAKAKLLDGYRCTIHWENIAAFREEFPNINVTDDIYEIDRNRYTCAGGTTPIDMMHNLISLQQGRRMSAAISEEFLIDNLRGMTERQRIPLRQQIGTSQPKLTEAVMLMETNIEECLSPTELANYVELSKRQLERLFKTYLDCTPMQYYLNLRLRNAKRLLLQTDKAITEIAISCGFKSSPHFSKSYKDLFNISPRDERRLILKRQS